MTELQAAVFQLLSDTAPAWAQFETEATDQQQGHRVKLPFASVFVGRVGPYPPDFFLELSGDQLIVCNQQFTAKIMFPVADPDLPEKVWGAIRADFQLTVLDQAGILTPARVAYERRCKPAPT